MIPASATRSGSSELDLLKRLSVELAHAVLVRAEPQVILAVSVDAKHGDWLSVDEDGIVRQGLSVVPPHAGAVRRHPEVTGLVLGHGHDVGVVLIDAFLGMREARRLDVRESAGALRG